MISTVNNIYREKNRVAHYSRFATTARRQRFFTDLKSLSRSFFAGSATASSTAPCMALNNITAVIFEPSTSNMPSVGRPTIATMDGSNHPLTDTPYNARAQFVEITDLPHHAVNIATMANGRQ